MSEQKAKNQTWLDRLTLAAPGYAGYQSHTQRRAAAFALRDALLRRLLVLHQEMEEAKATCEKHEARNEIPAVSRVESHLDRIIERVRGLGTRYESFYTAPDFQSGEVKPISAIDLELIEHAESMIRHFQHPECRDMLANLEADLHELELFLDGRALMLRGTQAP